MNVVQGDIRKNIEKRLEDARELKTTPFDYIIVGSGAGGGPLAARLALAGKSVLVLEAGGDPALNSETRGDPPYVPPPKQDELNEVSQVPGYHAAATEDPEMSWHFSVRHFANIVEQQKDAKYNPQHDPSASGEVGKGGIQYPRSAGIGGCTGHHAMIIIEPNDRDWNNIAEITGDDSWRSENMRHYFTRLENCLYTSKYQTFLQKVFGFVYTAYFRAVRFVEPRAVLDKGGHGDAGWQPTSFIDPSVVVKIEESDSAFKNALISAAKKVLLRKDGVTMLERALWKLRIVQFLDPNDRNTRLQRPSDLAFIPIGTDGVRRVGVREFLLKTAEKFPERLVIRTRVHATRIVFAKEEGETPNNAHSNAPRAIGVEVAVGVHLYGASPIPATQPEKAPRLCYFAKSEVIICGGTFNTPQLLMLSGIGEERQLTDKEIKGPRDAENNEVAAIVDLPGVGLNLQDRYEVTVVSEMNAEFSTLKGVSFKPGDLNDPARKIWLDADENVREQSLYTTNGGALAIMHRSGVDREPESDLFIFGAPAAFRGYYWGWSQELLHRTIGAENDQRNLWSWVILKAYTNNRNGRLSLRSSSPLVQPEIDFCSFQGTQAEVDKDVTALSRAIELVRNINAQAGFPQKEEIQPGPKLIGGSAELTGWIKNQAWGHHACGTCRMGSDRWQARPETLRDKNAVTDSQFRVHGVRGLRIVDASIFPDIPGYFIVTPVFMISEKAAETILPDSPSYPASLQAGEVAAIKLRREKALGVSADRSAATADSTRAPEKDLPLNTVGLALSGGGIRSATFCLGVLQALARRDRLRKVDFLSTVSGGGYIGAFLGRIYTRQNEVADSPGRVQDILTDPASAEIAWLRSNADYIVATGNADVREDLGVVWRNLFTVHLVLGAAAVAGFGVLNYLEYLFQAKPATSFMFIFPSIISIWWWIPAAILGLGAIPIALGFWLAPEEGGRGSHPFYAVLAWFVLFASLILSSSVPAAFPWAVAGMAILLAAYLWQEISRWLMPHGTPNGRSGTIVRNRLTGALGEATFIFGATLYGVVLDSIARIAAQGKIGVVVSAAMPAIGVLVAAGSFLTQRFAPAIFVKKSESGFGVSLNLVAALAALLLPSLLLVGLDLLVRTAFKNSLNAGGLLTVIALIFSLIAGQAVRFLNRSSLNSVYTARLTRTFLGASNLSRIFSADSDPVDDVQVAHPDDDLRFDQYHPERVGGPLHLMSVCINETVDGPSERELKKDRGLPMCVGPLGVSVGRRFHSLWEQDAATLECSNGMSVLKPIPTSGDPTTFHVLSKKDYKAVEVEALSLGSWMSISGAAFGPGLGRKTQLSFSILLGLFNLRIGYWWNSHIEAGERPGRYEQGLWQRLKALPNRIFPVQSRLLGEWRARFLGPSHRLWYLTDGGHFENTAAYELIRRRVPLIISVDAASDPDYQFSDLAILVRQTRMDFSAEFEWIEPSVSGTVRGAGWTSFGQGAVGIPQWIKDWINPDALGSRESIKQQCDQSAALARIRYTDTPGRESWFLLLKSSLSAELPVDVHQYADTHDTFPNESTAEQFFDDAQWESYRMLGDRLGTRLFKL